MKPFLLPLTALVLAGCASAPMREVPRQLFADALFLPLAEPPSADTLFELSDAMREFAATRIAGHDGNHGMQAALADTLKGELHVEYDSTATTAAAATFTSRSGNCLSLMILTAAFAKHFGVPVAYQSVHGHQTWSRSAGIAFLSGHVNLKLGSRGPDGLTVDFLAADSGTRRYTRPVAEETVVAMYFNNRAAEALVSGDANAAYWWARKAVETAPAYLSAFNTLGVVYLRHGNAKEAEKTLRYALVREPANVHVLANLTRALERQGRLAEAADYRKALAEIEPYPPFHFLDLGLAALSRGDSESALAHLKRELRRMPYDEEVHFALAQVDVQRGDLRSARRHLALAAEYSTTRDRRDIYGAKLAHLKTAR